MFRSEANNRIATSKFRLRARAKRRRMMQSRRVMASSEIHPFPNLIHKSELLAWRTHCFCLSYIVGRTCLMTLRKSWPWPSPEVCQFCFTPERSGAATVRACPGVLIVGTEGKETWGRELMGATLLWNPSVPLISPQRDDGDVEWCIRSPTVSNCNSWGSKSSQVTGNLAAYLQISRWFSIRGVYIYIYMCVCICSRIFSILFIHTSQKYPHVSSEVKLEPPSPLEKRLFQFAIFWKWPTDILCAFLFT